MQRDEAVGAVVDELFDEAGALTTTYAAVVMHRGVIVAERYGNELPSFVHAPTPVHPDTPLRSWSMAKSMLHAVIGMLVGDGALSVDDPAPVPAWQHDERAA